MSSFPSPRARAIALQRTAAASQRRSVIKIRLADGRIYGQTGTLDFFDNTVAGNTDTITLRGACPIRCSRMQSRLARRARTRRWRIRHCDPRGCRADRGADGAARGRADRSARRLCLRRRRATTRRSSGASSSARRRRRSPPSMSGLERRRARRRRRHPARPARPTGVARVRRKRGGPSAAHAAPG